MEKNTKKSSIELEKDARYHKAAVGAEPALRHLQPRIAAPYADLKSARRVREDAEDFVVEKLAIRNHADATLDDEVRSIAADAKIRDRRDATLGLFKALFPDIKPSVLVRLPLDEELKAVGLLGDALGDLPAGDPTREAHLVDLATFAVGLDDAVVAHGDAETEVSRRKRVEEAAQSAVEDALGQNEGAILELFKGNKARTRRYFRRHARKHGNGGKARGGAPVPAAP